MLDSASVLYPVLKSRDALPLWSPPAEQADTTTVVTSRVFVSHAAGMPVITYVDLFGSSFERVYGDSKGISEPAAGPARTQVISAALQANWSELAQSNLSNDSFARLYRLSEKQNGWHGPASLALHGSSLSSFLRLWHLVRDVAVEPELMLTPRGTLQAEWYRSHRQFLEIEFIKGQLTANFGLVDIKHRLEGSMPIEEVITFARNYRGGVALHWSAAA